MKVHTVLNKTFWGNLTNGMKAFNHVCNKIKLLLYQQMWMEAGFAALNTLSIGMGGTLFVGSRGKFRSSVLR